MIYSRKVLKREPINKFEEDYFVPKDIKQGLEYDTVVSIRVGN